MVHLLACVLASEKRSLGAIALVDSSTAEEKKLRQEAGSSPIAAQGAFKYHGAEERVFKPSATTPSFATKALTAWLASDWMRSNEASALSDGGFVVLRRDLASGE